MTSTGHRDLSSDERALLMAATQPGDTARTAWEQWKGTGRLATAGPRSQALFGQLYANVVGDLEGPETTLLRGVYKRTWYANQVLLGRMQSLASRLAEEGVSPLLLNDEALALGYYVDLGHRTIECLDLLVPAASWEHGLAAARSDGWRLDDDTSFGPPTGLSIATFTSRQNGSLRIWTNLFAAQPRHDTEARLWHEARSLEVHGRTVRLLGAEEPLLCTSAEAVCGREVPLSRYADAALVARRSRRSTIGRAWSGRPSGTSTSCRCGTCCSSSRGTCPSPCRSGSCPSFGDWRSPTASYCGTVRPATR